MKTPKHGPCRTAIAALAASFVLRAAGCGAGGSTDEGNVESPQFEVTKVEGSDGELQSVVVEEDQKKIAEWNGMADGINAAIDALDGQAFMQIFTPETTDLFLQIAAIDLAVAGKAGSDPVAHIVQQQKDFDVVFKIEDPDPGSGSATLMGVIRSSGAEVRSPIVFIEKDGKTLVDYTEVLAKRLDDLVAGVVKSRFAALEDAIAAKDQDGYAAVLTAESFPACADFMMALPASAKKKDGKKIVQGLAKAGVDLALDSVDTSGKTLAISGKAGEKILGPVTLHFTITDGVILIDSTPACTGK